MRERAKQASAQNHRVFSFVRNNEGLRMSQVMYALSANIHYSSSNKDITASIDVKAILYITHDMAL